MMHHNVEEMEMEEVSGHNLFPIQIKKGFGVLQSLFLYFILYLIRNFTNKFNTI